MAKTVINLRTSDIGKFSDNDLLLFDEKKGEFYRTTADNFYKPYEIKLEELKTKYDKIVKELEDDNARFKQETNENINKLTKLVRNFLQSQEENI